MSSVPAGGSRRSTPQSGGAQATSVDENTCGDADSSKDAPGPCCDMRWDLAA